MNQILIQIQCHIYIKRKQKIIKNKNKLRSVDIASNQKLLNFIKGMFKDRKVYNQNVYKVLERAFEK